MEHMVNHGTGWVRLEHIIPARSLIGFHTEFLTETRGTGILHHVFEGYEPWYGDIRTRPTGSLVADRRGLTTAYALPNLQERGTMFIGPGVEVYEGMIVGENPRPGGHGRQPDEGKEADQHALLDVRHHRRPHPAEHLSLEKALEFIREDECLEVTPKSVRLRKVTLVQHERAPSAQGRSSRRARAPRRRSPAFSRVQVKSSPAGTEVQATAWPVTVQSNSMYPGSCGMQATSVSVVR